jgi:hypothetical protein
MVPPIRQRPGDRRWNRDRPRHLLPIGGGQPTGEPYLGREWQPCGRQDAWSTVHPSSDVLTYRAGPAVPRPFGGRGQYGADGDGRRGPHGRNGRRLYRRTGLRYGLRQQSLSHPCDLRANELEGRGAGRHLRRRHYRLRLSAFESYVGPPLRSRGAVADFCPGNQARPRSELGHRSPSFHRFPGRLRIRGFFGLDYSGSL